MSDADLKAVLDMQRQQMRLLRAIAQAVGVSSDACPKCGNADPEKQVGMSTMGSATRIACTECGHIWAPVTEEVCVG